MSGNKLVGVVECIGERHDTPVDLWRFTDDLRLNMHISQINGRMVCQPVVDLLLCNDR